MTLYACVQGYCIGDRVDNEPTICQSFSSLMIRNTYRSQLQYSEEERARMTQEMQRMREEYRDLHADKDHYQRKVQEKVHCAMNTA